jgi:probable F420-dependent oxidoreductase
VTVKLGVMAPFVDGLISSGDFLREYAATLEGCGVESVFTVEHVIVAEDYEPLYPYNAEGRMGGGTPGGATMPDPLDLLAFLAAASTTLQLGTAVVVAPLHSPAVLAKRAATIDRISDGRLMLGLGIGWQKEEYAACGVPYKDRGARLEECIVAMRALWADRPATHHGRYWDFDRVHSRPGPTNGAIPIVLGGHSDAAVRRAGRIGDGWLPFTISAEEFAIQADLIRKVAAEAGRDPEAVTLSAWPGSADQSAEMDLDWVRRFVDAGATRLLTRATITRPDQLPLMREQLERYREAIIDRL